MKDLGDLSYFLGIGAAHTDKIIFLSQHKYALELLDRANMSNRNPYRTPADMQSKLDCNGTKVTRPYLISQFDWWFPIPHLYPAWFIIRGKKNKPLYDLSSQATYARSKAYSTICTWCSWLQATYLLLLNLGTYFLLWCRLVECPSTHQSISGYCVFLGNNLLS